MITHTASVGVIIIPRAVVAIEVSLSTVGVFTVSIDHDTITGVLLLLVSEVGVDASAANVKCREVISVIPAAVLWYIHIPRAAIAVGISGTISCIATAFPLVIVAFIPNLFLETGDACAA